MVSYFHWALHPWAIYAIVGLALAYFTYRQGACPNLISSAFYPLLGDRIHGPVGQGRSTSSRSSRRCSAARLARSRRASDQRASTSCGAWSRPTASRSLIIAVLTLVLRPVGGVRRSPRHPVAQQREHGARHLLLLFLLVVGPTVFRSRRSSSRRRLPHQRSSLRASAPARSGTESGFPPGRSSTGPGGSRGRRSSERSSRGSRGGAPSASSWSACC